MKKLLLVGAALLASLGLAVFSGSALLRARRAARPMEPAPKSDVPDRM